MVGESSGNLHLAGFTIMRHPEDVWLSDLSVITEPRNLQIWRHSVHLHSGSSQPQCFIMELLQNTWIYTKQVLGLKTWTVKCDNQMKEGRGGYLPQRRCTGIGQGVPLWPGRPAWERWGPEQRPEPRFRPPQELEDSQEDSIGDQSSYSWSLHCKVLDWIHLKTWLRQTFANQLHDLPFSI